MCRYFQSPHCSHRLCYDKMSSLSGETCSVRCTLLTQVRVDGSCERERPGTVISTEYLRCLSIHEKTKKVLSGCSNVLRAPLQLIQNTTQGCTRTPLFLTFHPAASYQLGTELIKVYIYRTCALCSVKK